MWVSHESELREFLGEEVQPLRCRYGRVAERAYEVDGSSVSEKRGGAEVKWKVSEWGSFNLCKSGMEEVATLSGRKEASGQNR